MPDPTVCAVMLTANRPEMAKQAVECFRAQTYTPREMMIIDTGDDSEGMFGSSACEPGDLETPDDPRGYLMWEGGPKGKTIGELRNYANMRALGLSTRTWPVEILCHWDDDDYSHPNRIAEQVALLQASGADAVGYNSMLFYREAAQTKQDVAELLSGLTPPKQVGEAWLYTGGICGSSLMYKRAAWERRHFEPMNNGEDTRFLMGVKAIGVSSLPDPYAMELIALHRSELARANPRYEPRMVARIHTGPSGNTSNAYNPDIMRAVERQGGEWRRVEAWDSYCRGVFA